MFENWNKQERRQWCDLIYEDKKTIYQTRNSCPCFSVDHDPNYYFLLKTKFKHCRSTGHLQNFPLQSSRHIKQHWISGGGLNASSKLPDDTMLGALFTSNTERQTAIVPFLPWTCSTQAIQYGEYYKHSILCNGLKWIFQRHTAEEIGPPCMNIQQSFSILHASQ